MFYDTFISLCSEKGKKPSDVSRELGIGKSTISMWKKQKSLPTAITLMQLAEYFNVTPAYLAGNKMARGPLHGDGGNPEKENPPAAFSEGKYPEKYNLLNETNKAIVDRLIADLAKSQSNQ